jgi:hypothetical protein
MVTAGQEGANFSRRATICCPCSGLVEPTKTRIIPAAMPLRLIHVRVGQSGSASGRAQSPTRSLRISPSMPKARGEGRLKPSLR